MIRMEDKLNALANEHNEENFSNECMLEMVMLNLLKDAQKEILDPIIDQTIEIFFIGTTARSYNALNIYSDRGNNQMIVRPTAKPREALVDAPAIVAPPSESELPRPITIEKTTYRSRNYFEPI